MTGRHVGRLSLMSFKQCRLFVSHVGVLHAPMGNARQDSQVLHDESLRMSSSSTQTMEILSTKTSGKIFKR